MRVSTLGYGAQTRRLRAGDVVSKKIGAYAGGLRHLTRSGDHLDYRTDEA